MGLGDEMSDLRKAAQEALEALEDMDSDDPELNQEWLGKQAIVALRVALAQPEQLVVGGDDLPTLTKWTPQRKPLTDDQIAEICMDCSLVTPSDIYFARAIKKAHKIE